MKWKSTPSFSPCRGGRVVADTDSSSSGTRSSRALMSVPLPTPEGPVMTKTRDRVKSDRLAAKHLNELGPLALGEPADGLARGDAALLKDLVDLHAPVLRDREEHVEDLRGLDPLGRLGEEVADRRPVGLQIALELGAPRTDVVRPLEGFHSLHEASFRGHCALCFGLGGPHRHGRRVYISGWAAQDKTPEFASTST